MACRCAAACSTWIPARGCVHSPKPVATAEQCADDARKLFMPPFWGGVLRQNLVDLQKFFKSLQLVFHDLGIMNQYQCVDLSLRHKVCPNRCLAESRGGAEHTCVLRQHCSGILLMKQHWRFFHGFADSSTSFVLESTPNSPSAPQSVTFSFTKSALISCTDFKYFHQGKRKRQPTMRRFSMQKQMVSRGKINCYRHYNKCGNIVLHGCSYFL